MLIRVLPALNCRDHWISLCRREFPCALIEAPETLVDFQAGYLQITRLAGGLLDGREAVKYSLGARHSLEPAWALVKACGWDLATLIAGLDGLDFSGNVRDNSLLGVHTDLTVRKFFARERHVSSPSRLGLLEPLTEAPAIWTGDILARLLANDQWRELRHEPFNQPVDRLPRLDITQLLLQLLEHPADWLGVERDGRLYLLHERRVVTSLVPDFSPPEPRLRRRPLL